MAAFNSVQFQTYESDYQRAILEKIIDPVSCNLLKRAVTIIPCGHILNEGTVTRCLAHNKLCPIDRQPIEGYIPNYTVRHFAENADSQTKEEEIYSPEAEAHFLKDMESASIENARKNQEEKENKASCKKEAYIDDLLRLFEEPAVMNHPSLGQLLEKEVEQLMNQESIELSATSIEKYKWTKKLLIDQKVSSLVAKKLQELSLSVSHQEGSSQNISSGLPASHLVTQSSSALPTPNSSPNSHSSATAIPEIAFGKAKWNRYFGDIGVEPPLPHNIEQVLNSDCIFWPGKKVCDTHLLVLIPNRVNGRAFHLNLLGELIKNPKTGHKTEYSYYSDYVKDELGTKIMNSHWVLMTRDVIPESRDELYDTQKNLVLSHAVRSGIPYDSPTALEAATAILMEYVQAGEMLYSNIEDTSTRCKEKVIKNRWPVTIGKFDEDGISICYRYFNNALSIPYLSADFIGIGCLRRFE